MILSGRSGLEGHPRGGPLVFALLLILLAGAGGGRGGPGRPRAVQDAPFARPLEIYDAMGLLAGPANFPVVASLSTLGGPADSSYVLLSLSLPNSALRFQREGGGFSAGYSVALELLQDSVVQARAEARESVRVGTFAETNRSDESIVFQQAVAAQPGRYVVQLRVADVNGARGFQATDTIDVPAYGLGGIQVSAPLLIYRAEGRGTRSAPPALIPNARHSAAYGGESPRIYIESYDLPAEQPLEVRVLDEAGASVWSATATLPHGDSTVRHGVVELAGAALPLGRLWVEVAAGSRPAQRAPLVLTISEQWMIANFEEVLAFLRYIAYPEEIDSLASATPEQRRERWERFWAIRDPLPVTDVNEYRDEFFERVRYATEAFREPGGRGGWDTDRGEVYIVLGPPMQVLERYIGVSEMAFEPNAEEWFYPDAPGGRLSLLFVDRSGLNRYELVPGSESAFRSVADRLKPRRR